MNYNIQELKNKAESLQFIQDCYDAYVDIVKGLYNISNKVYNNQNTAYYLNHYDWSQEISELVDEACEKFIYDSKYISYKETLHYIKNAIDKTNELAKENFINEPEIMGIVNEKLNNFYNLLEVFNNEDKIIFGNIKDMGDDKLSFLVDLDNDNVECFLIKSVIDNLEEFKEEIKYFAYMNPLLKDIDFLIDINDDSSLESADETIKYKLVDEVEKYGENALSNKSFLSGYFSSDENIRNIYRSSLQQINEMQNKFNENEETQHKIKRK